MLNVLFRQSEIENPYAVYAQMLSEHPVYFDPIRQIWAVYSYDDCLRLLNSEFAHIPDPNQSIISQMNEHARLIAEHLIRLQNPPRHGALHPLVLRLFEQLPPPSVHAQLDSIFAVQSGSLDWVVATRCLPAQALLDGFGFASATAEGLLSLLDSLVTFMLPGKSTPDLEVLNASANEAYALVERHISQSDHLPAVLPSTIDHKDALQIITANLIGLLLQSYDAGRGLLSNGLLYVVRQANSGVDYRSIITEMLRYDPPVHNTRRILTQNIMLGDVELKAGESVLLVLAAANRDQQHFAHPDQFDPLRPNNADHLTFGAGIHSCLARHYMMNLTVAALEYLVARYPNLHLLTEPIEFEPLVNVRLPRAIHIAL